METDKPDEVRETNADEPTDNYEPIFNPASKEEGTTKNSPLSCHIPNPHGQFRNLVV